jgi:hypothetical protein
LLAIYEAWISSKLSILLSIVTCIKSSIFFYMWICFFPQQIPHSHFILLLYCNNQCSFPISICIINVCSSCN